MKSMRLKKLAGFSLIEVLVFVTILALFFVAAMAVTIYSLRSMKTQQYKILASHLAEEANEWIKLEKENDWTEFIKHDTSGETGTTYCLNDIDLNWNNPYTCIEYSFGTPTIFKREVLIKNHGNQVDTSIIVRWLDSETEKNIVINAIHNIIE